MIGVWWFALEPSSVKLKHKYLIIAKLMIAERISWVAYITTEHSPDILLCGFPFFFILLLSKTVYFSENTVSLLLGFIIAWNKTTEVMKTLTSLKYMYIN